MGGPQRFRAGNKIKCAPQEGELATSPLTYGGSPARHSGGQDHKCSTCGRIGCITPSLWGFHNASERGTKSNVPRMGENSLHHPRLTGDPQHFKAGSKIKRAPQGGELAASPMPYGGSPTLQSGEQDHKCSTCGRIGCITPTAWGALTLQSGEKDQTCPAWGRIGYTTPALWGVPNASERGTRSSVPHNGADWLHQACRMEGPQRFRARHKIGNGPNVGGMATSPQPYGGSQTLQSGEQDQTCPAWGRTGYTTPALWGGGGQRFKTGNKITSGPYVGGLATSPLPYGGFPTLPSGNQIKRAPHGGELATSPLPYGGSPTLHSGEQDHKCSTCGRIGYITLAVWGVPNTLERGTKSNVPRKRANGLHHSCRMGGPQHFRAGNKITSAPHVGGLAASPLPYGGSPTLRNGEQDQTCPAWGRIGYITLA